MTLIISKGLTLDNGTRAAAIAGVSPTLDYRFARDRREIETVSLTDKLTYTGGNGTFVGSDGFIQRATTNVPRFDHDPLSRRSLGLLSEVERTNLLLRSEEFDSAAWTKFNATVTRNSIRSPDGTFIADKLVEGSTTSRKWLNSNISGLNRTFSIYAKAGERQYISFGTSNNSGQWGVVQFNLATGTYVNSASAGNELRPTSPAIKSVGNGWYYLSAKLMTGNNCVIQVTNGGNPVFEGYAGDGTSGIYIWGAQLESGDHPTSYIPTTTAAVTRTADSAVIDGTGVITGTYTMVEKPAGCAVVSGTNINLQPGFTAERVMVFPAALDAGQITAIRGAM
jgi:hypothetical protein